MRGALHELLHIADAGERVGNHALFLGRELRGSGNLLDVIAVGLGGGNAPGRSVRLLQESGIRQIRHHVANAGWTEAFAV